MSKVDKNLENKYIEELEKNEKLMKNDEEELHIYCDEILLDLLEDLGYKKVVKKYEEIKERNIFWYA